MERLAPSRDLAHNPLFQVGFRLGNTPSPDLGLAGLTVKKIAGITPETAKFDLAFAIHEHAGGLRVRAEYATDLFDAATVTRMTDQYAVLLQGIVADPAQPISRLPLLTAAERHRLLVEWSPTGRAGAPDTDIAELIEQQAARHPDASAVKFGRQRLSYAELDGRANRLAHRLRALGVGTEVPVLVALECSLEVVVAMLAILKAGGAYVPLNPDDPVRRLGLLIADSASPVLLTQRRVADRLPACAGTTLCLDTDWADIAGLAASAPPRSGNAARLAYVIHTSGSTGQPKGVMIEQRSLVGHLVAVQSQFGGTATDCVLQASPLSFDQSIWQILFPLVCGGCVALLEHGAHRAADEIVADIRRHGVTILRIVPALLAAIVGGPGLRECPSLRLVIVAGEVLEPALAESFAAQCGAELVNAYGPTEATFVSTSFRFQAGSGRHTVPIGRPIGDARLYVVDPHDQLLPIGVPGELCIGGPGVGRGYWRQPELTARAFVPDPFAMDPQARMYRTGDIARYLADGNLEFLGRRDRQVKVRGMRIELAEIDAALAAHPRVARCAAIVWRDAAHEEQLVAYHVARDGAAVTAAELRDFLRARLPAGMVPPYYVSLPSLPQTAHGKLDRKALPPPEPDDRAGAAGAHYVAPRSDVEARIAAIWAQTLRLPRVGVDSDFFDLGGHSLLAMNMVARVEADLGLAPTVREFFAEPTIAAMAGRIEAARTAARGGESGASAQATAIRRYVRDGRRGVAT